MNPLSGISFYDALSRLSIGLLILFPFTKSKIYTQWHEISDDTAINSALFVLLCFIVGLFFSMFIDWVCGLGSSEFFFYKNGIKRIKKEYKKLFGNYGLLEIEINLEMYWNIYYCVQKNGLLGNVKPLEALSAFLLNLGAVCLLYILWSFEYVCICYWKSYPIEWFSSLNSPGRIVILSVVVFIICGMLRRYIESNIYHNIISAYKFLLTYK